ncbi:MAG TPA: hypothetical protein VF625_00120, partial [Longimicrobium sp.]
MQHRSFADPSPSRALGGVSADVRVSARWKNGHADRPLVLLIDNYDSFTWNLVHQLAELGVDSEVVRNDALSADEALARG